MGWEDFQESIEPAAVPAHSKLFKSKKLSQLSVLGLHR
jgi:hypothetical protein